VPRPGLVHRDMFINRLSCWFRVSGWFSASSIDFWWWFQGVLGCFRPFQGRRLMAMDLDRILVGDRAPYQLPACRVAHCPGRKPPFWAVKRPSAPI
jgi:hypothetical protein